MQKWPLTGAAVVAPVLVTRSTLFSGDRHHGAAAHPTDAAALAPGACTVSSARGPSGEVSVRATEEASLVLKLHTSCRLRAAAKATCASARRSGAGTAA